MFYILGQIMAVFAGHEASILSLRGRILIPEVGNLRVAEGGGGGQSETHSTEYDINNSINYHNQRIRMESMLSWDLL